MKQPENGLLLRDASAPSSSEPERTAILAQLDHILASAPFRSSKRYTTFLRYVVTQTLDGNREELKERTLGVEVFGRDPKYDTNADPVVRLAAGEVRKRLAQYYYQHHEQRLDLRIELPTGSYIPEFLPSEVEVEAPSTSNSALIQSLEPTTAEKNREEVGANDGPGAVGLATVRRLRGASLWWSISSLLLVLAVGLFFLEFRSEPDPVKVFWGPVLASPGPVLISLGDVRTSTVELRPNAFLHGRFDSPFQLKSYQAEGFSLVAPRDVRTATNVVGLLKMNRRAFVIRDKDAMTFADLQNGPFVLIGGFSNDWTIRLTDSMRFYFDMNPAAQQWWIADHQKPDQKFGLHRTDLPEAALKDDYAIVARLFDPATRQTAIILAGIEGYGTQIAGDFVTNPTYLQDFAKHAPRGWDRKNVELLITTNIVDGEPGPPRVVASYFW